MPTIIANVRRSRRSWRSSLSTIGEAGDAGSCGLLCRRFAPCASLRRTRPRDSARPVRCCAFDRLACHALAKPVARVVATIGQHAQVAPICAMRDDMRLLPASACCARRGSSQSTTQRRAGQVLHEFVRPAVGDEPAVIEDREAMAALGLVHVMRRHEDRRAGVDEIEQRIPELAARLRIDRAGRLVEQQQIRARAARRRRARGAASVRPTSCRRAGCASSPSQ